jgi:hypothetical protein
LKDSNIPAGRCARHWSDFRTIFAVLSENRRRSIFPSGAWTVLGIISAFAITVLFFYAGVKPLYRPILTGL